MNNKEILNNVYKGILKFAGCTTDENGAIFVSLGSDESIPLTVDGKRVVLPTENNLKNPDENTIVFHPLAESIFKQESNISLKLRKAINIRLNAVTGLLARSLLTIMSDKDFHKNLEPEQIELVTKLTDIDSKTVETFMKKFLLDKEISPDKNFIFIYIKKKAGIKELNDKGVEEEKIYSRGGIVSFPFYEKLSEHSGKTFRVKDLKAYKDVMEYIFTDIHHTDHYNQGSSSRQSPTLIALLKTAVNIASILNDHIYRFKNFIPDYEDLVFDLDFYDYFNKENSDEILEKLIISVPPQDDSGGVIAELLKTEKKSEPIVTQPQKQEGYKPFTLTKQEQPRTLRTEKGLDWNSVINSNENVARTLNRNPGYGGYQMQSGYQPTASRRQPGDTQYGGGSSFSGFSRNRRNLF